MDCTRELRQLTSSLAFDYVCVHPNRPGINNLCEGNQEGNIDILLYVNGELFTDISKPSDFSITFVQSDSNTGNVLPSGSSLPAKDAKHNQNVRD